jgi:hypothetical protein
VHVFAVLHTIADARYLAKLGFWPDCAELRGFAVKISHTVEPTVEKQRLAWARCAVRIAITIPRPMPLPLRAMDFLATKGKPVSGMYLELRCRAFDEMIITLDEPQEIAFSSGFVNYLWNQPLHR